MSRIILLSSIVAVAFAAKFPVNQEKCKINDNSCLLRVTTEVASKAKDGYPELGLPVMDPLLIEKMSVNQGGNGPVTMKLNLKNILVRGLSGIEVTKFEGFKETFNRTKIEIRYKHANMDIHGQYKMDGKVLVLPVQGNGIANITLYNLEGVMKFLVKQVVKQEKKFMEIEKSKFSFDAGNCKVSFDGLFNGNKALTDSTNLFFNENCKDILDELKPGFSEAFGAIFTTLIGNVFKNFAVEDLFLL